MITYEYLTKRTKIQNGLQIEIMAESFNYEHELNELKVLLWGVDINVEIFSRWSQGFNFSAHEQSALEQIEGGPCAVIAPVQAFIVKNLLLEEGIVNLSNQVVDATRNELLVRALCEILSQLSDTQFRLVTRYDHDDVKEDETSPDAFHRTLQVQSFNNIVQVETYLREHLMTQLSQPYGVLIFLYSCLITKGIQNIQLELTDSSESLIDSTYGYGSQSLINLMITGRAVAHVWDNEQDIGGLKLCGIDKQSQIGFITLMEHMRYCTVGSFYKNPKHPVWVLGSETHLTVLFSTEKRLVSPETQSEKARRIFKSYDPDGNNFISALLLPDVLNALDLVSEVGYVEIMKKKLDPENLGIILLNAFMEEFFSREQSSTPDTFTLMHYNGLVRSNLDGKIQYNIGLAVLLECELKSICDSNPMLTCLQTKWPSIEVNWTSGRTPSLN